MSNHKNNETSDTLPPKKRIGLLSRFKKSPLFLSWAIVCIIIWTIFFTAGLRIFDDNYMYFFYTFAIISVITHFIRRENGKIPKFNINKLLDDIVFTITTLLISIPLTLIIIAYLFWDMF
jgi:hypothetical protein